ncbi:MAG: hypothetical protein IPL96_17325 [Holophagaceae bacterium]|nr:hypothetical protein [Holophagaceae bacterium]
MTSPGPQPGLPAAAGPGLSGGGELEDAEELLRPLAAGLRPDALFLDIEMPGAFGLEVPRSSRRRCPWSSSPLYLEHAVRAFDTTAVDYILKLPSTRTGCLGPERVHSAPALLIAGQTGKPVAPTPARCSGPGRRGTPLPGVP